MAAPTLDMAGFLWSGGGGTGEEDSRRAGLRGRISLTDDRNFVQSVV